MDIVSRVKKISNILFPTRIFAYLTLLLSALIYVIRDGIYFGGNMNLEKIKERIESTKVVEELILLSSKVFDKNSDDVKKVIEAFITKSYLMGKKNMAKTIED
jgi:hypothetical protein